MEKLSNIDVFELPLPWPCMASTPHTHILLFLGCRTLQAGEASCSPKLPWERPGWKAACVIRNKHLVTWGRGFLTKPNPQKNCKQLVRLDWDIELCPSRNEGWKPNMETIISWKTTKLYETASKGYGRNLFRKWQHHVRSFEKETHGERSFNLT